MTKAEPFRDARVREVERTLLTGQESLDEIIVLSYVYSEYARHRLQTNTEAGVEELKSSLKLSRSYRFSSLDPDIFHEWVTRAIGKRKQNTSWNLQSRWQHKETVFKTFINEKLRTIDDIANSKDQATLAVINIASRYFISGKLGEVHYRSSYKKDILDTLKRLPCYLIDTIKLYELHPSEHFDDSLFERYLKNAERVPYQNHQHYPPNLAEQLRGPRGSLSCTYYLREKLEAEFLYETLKNIPFPAIQTDGINVTESQGVTNTQQVLVDLTKKRAKSFEHVFAKYKIFKSKFNTVKNILSTKNQNLKHSITKHLDNEGYIQGQYTEVDIVLHPDSERIIKRLICLRDNNNKVQKRKHTKASSISFKRHPKVDVKDNLDERVERGLTALTKLPTKEVKDFIEKVTNQCGLDKNSFTTKALQSASSETGHKVRSVTAYVSKDIHVKSKKKAAELGLTLIALCNFALIYSLNNQSLKSSQRPKKTFAGPKLSTELLSSPQDSASKKHSAEEIPAELEKQAPVSQAKEGEQLDVHTGPYDGIAELIKNKR